MPNHGGQALENFLEFFLGILHFCISVTFLKKKGKNDQLLFILL